MLTDSTIPFLVGVPYCAKHGEFNPATGCGGCDMDDYNEQAAKNQDVPWYYPEELAPKVVDPHAHNPEDPDDIAF